MMDPQFIGSFSQKEASIMRSAYQIAVARNCADLLRDEKQKYTLASIVLYIASCEKKEMALIDGAPEAIACEALEVFAYIHDSNVRPIQPFAAV